MSEDYSFLTYLINEDIYYIDSAPEEAKLPQDRLMKENNASTPGGGAPPAVSGESAEERNMTERKAENKQESGKIDFTGENLKEILVLVNDQQHRFLGVEDMAFLEKVLGAVGVGPDDIALVNIGSVPTEQINDVTLLSHRLSLCFLEKMPDALREADLVPYQNLEREGKKILWCDPLASISRNKEMKIKLWQQLKLLFNK